MRLTSDIILEAEQGLNCIGDRELVLRNKAIPAIENLAVARDGFDTIDLSANMISVLGDGFPPFPRLQSLYLGANRITRILRGAADSLPNLRVLILTSNRLRTVEDLNLEELSRFAHLEVLSINDNPVAEVPGIRQRLIEKLPSLAILNFRKVSQDERKAASEANPGSQLGKRKGTQASSGKKRRRTQPNNDVKTFVVGGLGGEEAQRKPTGKIASKSALSKEQSEALRSCIEQAQSVEDVAKVQEAIRNGTVAEYLGKMKSASRDAAAAGT